MAVELAAAYVSIIPETSKIAPGVAKALGGAEKAAGKSGRAAGGLFGTAMGGALKKTALGVGAAAGAAVGGAMAKGMGRLTAIENAQASLRGLGHDARSVEGIMNSALASVKGTAFGLGEAASVAASTVAAGVAPGRELERTLRLVADTATIAGLDMQAMGSIINKVATSDMMQMDVANQLMDAGIPILQMVAAEMGVTAGEAAKLASSGKVSFEIFQNALEKGVGGAALEAGNTFTGAMDNMGAALGRVGATALKPFYEASKKAMNAVTGALDVMNDRIGPFADRVATWMGGTAAPAVEKFAASLQGLAKSTAAQGRVAALGEAFSAVAAAGRAVAPAVGEIAAAVGKATAAIGVSTWDVFVATLKAAASVVETLAGPLGAVAGLMSDHPGLVTAAVAAWAGLKTVPGLLGKVTDAVTPQRQALSNLRAGVADIRAYYQASGREITRFSAAMQYAGTSSNSALQAMGRGYSNASVGLLQVSAAHKTAAAAAKANALQSKSAFTSIDFMAQQAGHSFVASTAKMGAAAKGLAAGGLGVLKSGISGLVGALGGPWGVAFMGAAAVIGKVTSASQQAKAAQEAMAQASRSLGSAQRELHAALVGTSGELGEQGMAAATRVANLEMTGFLEQGKAVQGFFAFMPESIKNSTDSMIEQSRMFYQLRDGYKELESTAKDLGISMEALPQVIAQGGPEYDNLINQLRASGEEGNYAADQLAKVRDSLEQQIEVARRVPPGFVEISNAIDTLADSASSGEKRLSAMRVVLEQLGLVPRNAEQAMMDAAAAVDKIVASAKAAGPAVVGLADSMFKANGELNEMSPQARDAAGALRGMYEDLVRVAESGGDVQATFSHQQTALDAMARQYGFTGEQVQALREQYKLMPETVQTLIALQGVNEANAELAKVAIELQRAAPDQKTIDVSVRDEATLAKLQELKLVVGQPMDGVVTVKADDLEARAKLSELTNITLPALDAQHAEPSANLDVAGFLLNDDLAKQRLMELDQGKAFPWANLDISQLTAEQIEALNLVGLLDGQTPTPQANMNISELTSEQQAAMALIFDLSAQRPTPWASLTKAELEQKAAEAKQRLNELHRTRTEPTVTVQTAGALGSIKRVTDALMRIPSAITTRIKTVFSSEGRAEGGIAGFRSGGVTGYATGGKLPVTGPGTRTTDGILGVDAHGVPTARVDAGEWVINRRSSRKHDGLLRAINDDDPRLEQLRGIIPGYVTGGVVTPAELRAFAEGKRVRGQQAARSLQGAPYVWGGVNWGDCCLIGQTQVWGPDGPKRIDELEPGDRVFSYVDGRLATHKVVKQWFSKRQDTYRVRTHHRSVVGSDNHPFLRVVKTAERAGNTPATWGTEWARLDELREGDLLVQPRTPSLEPKNDRLGNRDVDEDIAWLAGLILGDGHISDTRIEVCVYGNMRDHAAQIFERMGAASVAYSESHGLRAHASALAREFAAAGLRKPAHEKEVPACVWGWSLKLQRAFLMGYRDADGYIHRDPHRHGYCSYSSASRTLIDQIRILHVMVGDQVTNVTINRRHKKITIKGKQVKKARPLHTFSVSASPHSGEAVLRRHRGLAEWLDQSDFTLERVISVTPEGVQDTYDITVEGAHNFVADGIVVHNSGAMSALARFAVGLDAFAGRFATMNERSELAKLGFRNGKGGPGDFRIAWYNGGAGGGHTWGVLPDGTAVEMRGGGRGGIIGGDAWTLDNGRATDFAFLPMARIEVDHGIEYGTEGWEPQTPELVSRVRDPMDSSTVHSGEGDHYTPPLSSEASLAADRIEERTDGALSKAGAEGNPLLTSDRWSALAGSVVATAVSGQIADILNVFGIPDELPPIVKAGQQWVQMIRETAHTQQAKAVEEGEKAVIDMADVMDQADEAQAPAPGGETGAATGVAATSAGSTESAGATATTASASAAGKDDVGITAGAVEPADVASTGDPTKDAVRQAVASRGWDSGEQWDALEYIIDHESGWQPQATNASSGAYGLFQLNPASGTLQAYMPSRSNDPAVQAEAGARYISDRYGDPVAARAFWEKNHWYDSGGRANGIGVMMKNTLKPERVLSPEQTKAFEDLVFSQMPKLQAASEDLANTPQQQAAEPPQSIESGAIETGAVAKQIGSLESTVHEAIPMLLEANSLSELAGMAVSGAVRAGGGALTQAATGGIDMLAGGGGSLLTAGGGVLAAGGAAGTLVGMVPAAALAPVGAAVAAAGPALSAVAPIASSGVGMVGNAATELAAWYSGQVASGVVGAFEQYAQEMIGATPLGIFQDLVNTVRPVVGGARTAMSIGAAEFADMQQDAARPVQAMSTDTSGGDVYNFNAVNVDQLMSVYRRESAKNTKGLVGAR